MQRAVRHFCERAPGMLPKAGLLLLLGVLAAFAQSEERFERSVTTISGGVAEVAAIDKFGRVYLAGTSVGTTVLVTPNALQTMPASVFHPQGFLLVVDETVSSVLYGTYLNGLRPKKLRVDDAGYVYVLAEHPELDNRNRVSFPAPISPNAVQTSPGLSNTPVLLKIAPNGQLVYGTFLGGWASVIGGLDVDARGAATVCGATADFYLPVSPGAVHRTGEGSWDVYIARLNPDGSRFEALTYLGGGGSDFCEEVKLDSSGNVLVYGDTNSRFFPVTADAYRGFATGTQDLFVAKLTPDLDQLLWSTYVGGSGFNRSRFLAVATDGRIVLTGETTAFDFTSPGTAPAFIPIETSGSMRPFVALLDPTGSRLLSAYAMPFLGWFWAASATAEPLYAILAGNLGASYLHATLNASDLAAPPVGGSTALLRFDIDAQLPTYLGPTPSLAGVAGIAKANGAELIVAGQAFPQYNLPDVSVQSIGAGSGSAIVHLNFDNERLPLTTQLLNAASLMPGPVSPGQLLQLRGLGLGSPETTRVLMDGLPVAVEGMQPNSILAVAPTSFAQSTVSLAVERDGTRSEVRQLRTTAANPALFTAGGTGTGPALAFNEDGLQNSPERPATKGRPLRLLATGLGLVEGLQESVTVWISGLRASVRSVGPAAGYPSGYMAIDAIIPAEAPDGDFLPAQISVRGVSSQPGVTVSLR